MASLLLVLQYAVAIAFIALGVLTLVQWLRHKDQSRGYLALAIGSLGAVALLGQVQPDLPADWRAGVQVLSVAFFQASGFGVLLFRHAFLPLRRETLWVAAAALALSGLVAIAVNPSGASSPRPSALQSFTTVLLVLTWSACVGEPIVRFWLLGRGRPRVQRSRLRALSLGFAGIIAILLVSAAAGAALRGTASQVGIELVALLIVPLLYASFSPPGWLRRTWREREETQYRSAIQQLLLFSPTRQALAERAVEWAVRLVGADGAALIDADSSIVALHGLTADAALHLMQLAPPGDGTRVEHLNDQPRHVLIALDLPTNRGIGRLLVLAGAFTPVFGMDEIIRLEDYSSAVTAGLDRTSLTERLAALERTKTQFLNLASHELRGPITVLRGYLSMFEKGALSEQQVHSVLPVLLAKTEEMNLLIEQMLEASRLEEGRLELHRQRVDLRDLVAHSVSMMQPLADSEHRVLVHCPESPITVEVDPDRIGIILNNLIDNAIKYSPDGGEVRCAVERHQGLAHVRVTDHGIGIDESQLPHLFTRFGRIVTAQTSNIRGTGLGLYLARELARMHGGDITVESKPGRGSTFVMAVPLAG